MEKETVLEQLNDIFIDVLDNDEIALTFSTVADDIEEWDSLSHIQLIVAIEKHFNLKFSTPEIQGWNNVGDICDSVSKKL